MAAVLCLTRLLLLLMMSGFRFNSTYNRKFDEVNSPVVAHQQTFWYVAPPIVIVGSAVEC